VNPGHGYAAGVDLWINPPGAGLPTSSTPAWTTQKRRCPHTHSRYCYKRFYILKIKDQGFKILRNSKNNGDIER